VKNTNWAWAFLGLLALAVRFLAGQFPEVTDQFYSQTFFPVIRNGNKPEVRGARPGCRSQLYPKHKPMILCIIQPCKNHLKEIKQGQNYYCEQQQQNPHVPRAMLSLGLPEDDVKTFLADNLFPIVK
jgi:hypothetical protein